MAWCLAQNPDGSLAVLTPQPADLTTCSAVVLSGSELSHLGSIWQPLTASDGAQISLAIAGVWAMAFGFRLLTRQAKSDFSTGSGDE